MKWSDKIILIVVADLDEINNKKIINKLMKKRFYKINKKYWLFWSGVGGVETNNNLTNFLVKYKDKIKKIINIGLVASNKFPIFSIIKPLKFLKGDNFIYDKNVCVSVDKFSMLDFKKKNCEKFVMDMEAYDIDWLCRVNQIPLEVIKIVVDHGNYNEYKQNLKVGVGILNLIIDKILKNDYIWEVNNE